MQDVVAILPDEYVRVLITYKTMARIPDGHYGREEKQTVTCRAFYSKSNGYYNQKDEWIETPNGFYSTPHHWMHFRNSDGTISLLPHGFNSYGRVFPENVIEWKIDTNDSPC
jgi:hypothetical protein